MSTEENVVKPAKSAPRVCLFLAQPAGTLIGPGKPFTNVWDLCKWAKNECGYEGVTAPAGLPFVDIDEVLRSDSYGPDILAKYKDCGTPLRRLEMHVVGQRMLMHPANMIRYKMFAPDWIPNGSVQEQEALAEKQALNIVSASAKLGFKEIVDFSGNRGWTAAKYPWSAYPLQWCLFILLLLIHKHRKVLATCAECGIKRGFELHPEEDLNSPLLLYLFRELAK